MLDSSRLSSDARPPPPSRDRLSETSHRLLEPCNLLLMPSVEDPLFDALGSQQPNLRQYPQVLAHRRLTDTEFFRDQHAANPISDKIAIDLWREMYTRIFQPGENQQTPIARQSPQRRLDLVIWHIAN